VHKDGASLCAINPRTTREDIERTIERPTDLAGRSRVVNHPIDRRAFSKALAAAGALPMRRHLPGADSSVADASDRGAGRRVVVLGAALARLDAAYDLRSRWRLLPPHARKGAPPCAASPLSR
jgi:hypothetical protein